MSAAPASRVALNYCRGWLAVTVAVILAGTLCPLPDWPGARVEFFASLLPHTRDAWLDVIQNILLFVPLGVVCRGGGWSVARSGLIAFALSMSIELSQYLIPGRDPTAIDVVTNTIGATLGAWMLGTTVGPPMLAVAERANLAITALLDPANSRAGLFCLGWALFVGGVFLATAWLLGPPASTTVRVVVPGPLMDRPVGPLRIGSATGANGFKGLIDEVRVFGTVRSEAAIRVDMLRPVSADPQKADALASYGFDTIENGVTRDSSGRGHDGTLRLVTPVVNGRFGAALQFDGGSSAVEVPFRPDLALRDAVTIEAWIKPTLEPAPWSAVVAWTNDSYYMYASSDPGPIIPAAGGRYGGSDEDTRALDPLPLGRWSHLAMTYDGQQIRLFINGSEASRKVRWSPHRPVSETLNGSPLPFGVQPRPDMLHAVLEPELSWTVVVACGAEATRRAPIAQMVANPRDAWPDALIELDADRSVTLATWGTRASRHRWPSPSQAFPGAVSGCSNGSVRQFALSGPRHHAVLTVDGVPFTGRPITLAWGWAFLLHSELMPEVVQTALCGFWLVVLILPFGFWFRANVVSMAAGLLPLLCLIATPYEGGAAPLAVWQSAIVLLAFGAGLATRRGAVGW